MARRNLKGATVVLTGASSGIGRGAAYAFAQEGANLVLAARREEVLWEVVTECEGLGARAKALPTDSPTPRPCASLPRPRLRSSRGGSTTADSITSEGAAAREMRAATQRLPRHGFAVFRPVAVAACEKITLPQNWVLWQLILANSASLASHPMTPQQNAKIESGVSACLDRCRGTDRPYKELTAYIASLKVSQQWSDAEIIALQTQVIRLLLSGTQNADSLEAS